MRRIRYLDQTWDDVHQIANYIGQRSGNLEVGIEFTERLLQQCLRIAELPGQLGRARPDLGSDLRSLPYGNYMIIFRYLDCEVEIVTIIEGHRDIDSLF